jgi:hypothetical protein
MIVTGREHPDREADQRGGRQQADLTRTLMQQRFEDRQDDGEAPDIEGLDDKGAREQQHKGPGISGRRKPLQPRRQEQRFARDRRHSFTPQHRFAA